MDKNAIKKYAVWARRELIERVSQRAMIYGITAKDAGDPNAESVNGHLLSQAEKRQRQALIRNIKEKGYEQVMEEVAYTWFNRFAALRFMEVNGYLPSHIRVFTNDAGEFKPQILAEAIHLELDGLDMNKVYELESANKSEELFKYLLIVQCNALNSILPGMFQRIDDYTELLLPDYLLREGSVIEQMVAMIPEEDWTDQVQIIGWLYQYYNTEPKDKVFADLKKNIKITKENIPAATQLFTPDWIVHYMVENSLGRMWIERVLSVESGEWSEEERIARETEIADSFGWKYYLTEAPQEPEVRAQLNSQRSKLQTAAPTALRVIDPCMGSGHILCVLFDVLVQIYEAYGYTAREAAVKIVENNLWGLDIDERAAQLAYFAVMMKARQYDRRFLTRGVQPRVYAVAESNGVSDSIVAYFGKGDDALTNAMQTIVNELHDAKEYGSILTCTAQDWNALYDRFDEIADEIDLRREEALALLSLVRTAEALSQQYDAVVTNPPYMGASNMNPKLNEFIKKFYTDYKSDFFSAFMVRCSAMTKPNGYCGFFTPYVWMFIQSYEKLRHYLYSKCTIETLIQFEYSAFEEATVPVCTFAFSNRHVDNKKGCYLRLTDFRGGMEVQRQKTIEALSNHKCGFYFEQSTDNFSKIPGSPVAYWVSGKEVSLFDSICLANVVKQKMRINTGDNAKYLRMWYEVDAHDLFRPNRWIPFSKGGEYRKWYGNWDYVLDYLDNGAGFKACPGYRGSDENNFFLEGIVWTDLTSGKPSFRYFPPNCIASAAGPMLGMENDEFSLNCILAFLNSSVARRYTEFLCPTIHFQWGDIGKLPIIINRELEIDVITKDCVSESSKDWDSFETSWNFKKHPFMKYLGASEEERTVASQDGAYVQCPIAYAYSQWMLECDDRFNRLKANEEELNRIFIDIYGLQGELTPDVEDKDVTVRQADLGRDIRSFISYAVGCMFGRYSPDVDGLAYAGGEWDDSKYVTFLPDKDAILPICDDEYFDDDIVARFVQFVEVVYGAETLEENLRFIADALGGKGSARDVIRRYFINDFYADHCKIYQKRPIYWLFDSGKKNGFKCLIYMHRYQPDTIARIRTDYVHEQQSRYRTAIADLEQRINGASTSERVKLSKQLATLQAQAEEIRVYEEKIHHLADQMIKIDLDDGVKVNYAKFADVLAKLK